MLESEDVLENEEIQPVVPVEFGEDVHIILRQFQAWVVRPLVNIAQ
jgi:hypothetical protein